MSAIRNKRKTAKLGAHKAVRKAKAFVLLTYDYDGRIHLEAETSAMVSDLDIYQQTMQVAENYLQKLTLAAISRDAQERCAVDQAERVIEAKEERSKVLTSFSEDSK